MSWIRNINTARWFAKNRGLDGKRPTAVYSGTVRSGGVLAIIDARGEGQEPEVVIDPGFLTNIRKLETYEASRYAARSRSTLMRP
jgi:hypothetical protein